MKFMRFLFASIILFFCWSCSATSTSLAPSADLKPVLLKLNRSEAMDLIYSSAQKAFPGEPCERDDALGAVRIRRQYFWRGDSLVTASLRNEKENEWLVNIDSKGVGFNGTWLDMSYEIKLYIDVLTSEYSQYRKAKDSAPEKLSEKLKDLKFTLDNGLISQEEYEQKRKEAINKF